MNILFFLTPKAEVEFLDWNYSLRQALEKMQVHKYSSIPIISNEGEYVGTLTEGDMLWYFYNNNDTHMSQEELEEMPLTVVPRRIDYETVNASSNMEDLLSKIMKQNFVPVVDDCDNFIGIIKRKDVIQYYYDRA
ncbi:MAG: CBS domain-containing protein [Lachnospiraceae bacterium]|nr:CBS domain-containing protein [Lachnospiraceae bacterium]